MCQPQRNELRIQTQSLSFRVRNAGEMLETNERDALAVNDQLTGVSRTNSNHEQNVYICIRLEESAALLFGVSCERDDVDSFEHRPQVYSTCKCGRSNDFLKMGTRRVEDVIVP